MLDRHTTIEMNAKHSTALFRIRLLTEFLVITGLSLLLSGCSSPNEKADLIMSNGKVITVDEKFSIAQAVAIRNGRVIWVGDNRDVDRYRGASTAVIDLAGRAVIPGLNEFHAHPISASQSEHFEPIPDLHTIADVLEWVRVQAEAKEHDEWIVHPKFFITRLTDMRQITRKELDAVAPRNPVFLNGSYGGLVNTRAIELSGLNEKAEPGILRDKSGRATGVLRRSAFSLLAAPAPKPLTDQEKSELLRQQFSFYNSIGITSVCSGGGTIQELKAFQELMDRNELTVRVFHNIRVPFDLGLTEQEMIQALKEVGVKTGVGNEWVKVGALKVVLDGGMLTGTAFLHEGWGHKARDIYGIEDPSYRGELFISGRRLINVIKAATATGWKFTAHVTGGAGVDTLLAAYEAVNRTVPLADRRFSVIHGNFFTPHAIEKMAAMGIYADSQPAWFFKDTDLLHAVLGTDRINDFHPYRSLISAGVIVNGGSDHMVKTDPNLAINPYNPFTAIWSVVTRKTERGTKFNPEQSITREEALKMYTINNAMASFEEDVKGSIEPGKFADLVVLSHDILTCDEDAIKDIRPVLTVLNGEVVFDNGELSVPAPE